MLMLLGYSFLSIGKYAEDHSELCNKLILFQLKFNVTFTYKISPLFLTASEIGFTLCNFLAHTGDMMHSSITQTVCTRRNFIVTSTAISGGIIADPADAFFDLSPLLPIIGIGIGVGAAAWVASTVIEAYRNRNKYQKRLDVRRDVHDALGADHELLSSLRNTVIPMEDGGKIVIGPGGVFFTAKPGATPTARSDMTLTEIETTQKLAPYSNGPRAPISQTREEQERGRKKLENIFQEPIKKMRYVRAMAAADGSPHLFVSAVAEKRKTELACLFKIGDGKLKPVNAFKAQDWSLEYARDLA